MISIVLLIRRGSGHKVPYLTKKLFVMESCQERGEKSVFINEVTPGISAILQNRPHAQE